MFYDFRVSWSHPIFTPRKLARLSWRSPSASAHRFCKARKEGRKEVDIPRWVVTSFLLLMAEILHHRGCMKPYKRWDKLPINWCRISSINSRDGFWLPLPLILWKRKSEISSNLTSHMDTSYPMPPASQVVSRNVYSNFARIFEILPCIWGKPRRLPRYLIPRVLFLQPLKVLWKDLLAHDVTMCLRQTSPKPPTKTTSWFDPPVAPASTCCRAASAARNLPTFAERRDRDEEIRLIAGYKGNGHGPPLLGNLVENKVILLMVQKSQTTTWDVFESHRK